MPILNETPDLSFAYQFTTPALGNAFSVTVPGPQLKLFSTALMVGISLTTAFTCFLVIA